MNPRPRAAFTLFQLLVLLALLALLFSLLLPAVAKVRQAAGRNASQNNMKQLALACHNYHDTYQKFCPGNNDNNFSAAAYLLPYIEQENVYKQIDFKKPISDKANETARKLIIKTFLSPQDSRPQVTEDSAATNYLFSAGSKYALADNDGVFYQNSGVKFQEITDGTSNTILAGETLKGDGGTKAEDVRRQHVKLSKDALTELKDETGVDDFKNNKNIAGDRCASWIDGRFLQGTFTCTRLPNDAKPDATCAGLGGLSALRCEEGKNVNIAMCDGSVRVLNPKVSMETWKALATRAGGEVIGNDF